MSDPVEEVAESGDLGVIDSNGQRRERRKIPGGLPYTNSPGTLKKVLEKLPDAEKPSVFNSDFLGTVLGETGGSARAIPPIFKTMGFLDQSGSPTELYSQFQTQSGRSSAALQALKNGYVEIFKRNQYAHRAEESALMDIAVAITGLPKNNPTVRSIVSTFQTLQAYARSATETSTGVKHEPESPNRNNATEKTENNVLSLPTTLGLAYNINIALPETTNIEVYNAIFRSIRANLLT